MIYYPKPQRSIQITDKGGDIRDKGIFLTNSVVIVNVIQLQWHFNDIL
jgi:hypothetical protein